MLKFNSIILFSENPSALVDFYQKVFESKPNWEGGDLKAFKVGSIEVCIGPHDKVSSKNSQPERFTANYEVSQDKFQDEFKRIKGIGVKVIQKPYQHDEEQEMWVATFADPDGNYFQLVTHWGVSLSVVFE